MSIRQGRQSPAIMLCLAALAACGPTEAEDVYPLTADMIRTQLQAVEVPWVIFGTEGANIESSPIVDDQKVIWPVRHNGDELFRFAATIAALEPARTRVIVTIEPSQGEAGRRVQQGMKANPDIVEIYQDAMVEAVDAGLEQRPYDMNAMRASTLKAAANRMDEIRAKFDRDIVEHRKETRSNLERAYERQGLEY